MSNNSEKTIRCQKNPYTTFCKLLIFSAVIVGAALVFRDRGRKVLEKFEGADSATVQAGGFPSEKFDNATHTFIGARNLRSNPHEGQYLLFDSDGDPETIEAVAEISGAKGGRLTLTDLVTIWELQKGEGLMGKQIKELCPTAETTVYIKGEPSNTGARFWRLSNDKDKTP